jgi:putative nucleotidyltransferase with HDIG domain
MSARSEILDAIDKIEALPAAAAETIALMQNPEANIDELTRSIEYDPGITANILRLANSSYFGGAYTVTSVRDAFVRLGQQRVMELLALTVMDKRAGGPILGYDLPAGALVTQAMAAAIGVEKLAAQLGKPCPPDAFTASLLHDIGKVVLGTFVEIDAAPIVDKARGEGIPFDEAERAVLGIDHAEVGALILTRWGFPNDITDPVYWHHRPTESPHKSDTLVFVHAMDAMVSMLGIGGGVDACEYRPAAAWLAGHGLSTQVLETVVAETMPSLHLLEELTGAAHA